MASSVPPSAVTNSRVDQLNAGSQGVASGGYAVGSAYSVYMGQLPVATTMTSDEASRRKSSGVTSGGQDVRNVQDAYNEFYRWGPAEFNLFQAQAKMMGHNTKGWTPFSPNAMRVWQEVVNSAAAYGAVNASNPLTPYEVLERSAAAGAAAGMGGAGATSSTVVNLTNPADAKTFVNNSLKDYLGRQATQSELDTFLSSLNSVERKNPVYRSQTQQSGGTNPQQVAEEFAQSRPEAAEYTAATQYSSWLMQKISEDTTAGVESGL